MLSMKAFLAPVLAVTGLVGCSHPRQTQQRQPQPWPPSASLPDRYFVSEAALQYMFEQFAQDKAPGRFRAYVLNGEEFTSELVAAFQAHRPVVVARVHLPPNTGRACDPVAGGWVRKWTVRCREIRDDEATVRVTWYLSPLASAAYTLYLRRTDGRWRVESEKLESIS